MDSPEVSGLAATITITRHEVAAAHVRSATTRRDRKSRSGIMTAHRGEVAGFDALTSMSRSTAAPPGVGRGVAEGPPSPRRLPLAVCGVARPEPGSLSPRRPYAFRELRDLGRTARCQAVRITSVAQPGIRLALVIACALGWSRSGQAGPHGGRSLSRRPDDALDRVVPGRSVFSSRGGDIVVVILGAHRDRQRVVFGVDTSRRSLRVVGCSAHRMGQLPPSSAGSLRLHRG